MAEQHSNRRRRRRRRRPFQCGSRIHPSPSAFAVGMLLKKIRARPLLLLGELSEYAIAEFCVALIRNVRFTDVDPVRYVVLALYGPDP